MLKQSVFMFEVNASCLQVCYKKLGIFWKPYLAYAEKFTWNIRKTKLGVLSRL